MPRLLVAFPQCPFDPASGAARSTRLIGEWLAASGWEVRCVSAGFSEARRWLTAAEFERLLPSSAASVAPAADGWMRGVVRGVAHACLLAPQAGRVGLDAAGVARLAAGVRAALGEWRPDVVLTYGDDDLWRELRAAARSAGARVVYAVHNAAHAPAAFATADAVLAPSAWLVSHYTAQGVGGLHALPPPLDPGETLAPRAERVFTTFVNPSREKGLVVFLRLAAEIARLRPEVPLLVVEGRARGADLLGAAEAAGLDLKTAGNLMIAPAVAQPREIFALTRTLLVPSLTEAAGRVVAEAQLNGIPCLVSDRGGLPETCGTGGVVLPLPNELDVHATAPVAAAVVEPWLEHVTRWCDDEAAYAAACTRAWAAGERFTEARLRPQYAAWFAGLR